MIQLYSYFRSSCSWRVRIALNVLKVPYELKPINLLKNEHSSVSYLALNPLGTVPAIVTPDNSVIWQSLAIIDFLDQHKRLLPKDATERARCIQITQTIVSEIQPLQNLSVTKRIEELAGEKAKTEWAIHHNRSKLKIINDHLVHAGSKFCVGNDVTLADVCLVPQLYSANRFGLNLRTEFPNLFEIAKSLEQMDEFKNAHAHAQPDCPEDIRELGVLF